MIRTNIIGLVLLVSIISSQVNTEAMRSAKNSNGFQNKFNLELGYKKASSEVFNFVSE